jgi:hypothetical protein
MRYTHDATHEKAILTLDKMLEYLQHRYRYFPVHFYPTWEDPLLTVNIRYGYRFAGGQFEMTVLLEGQSIIVNDNMDPRAARAMNRLRLTLDDVFQDAIKKVVPKDVTVKGPFPD